MLLPGLQELLGVERAENLDQLGDDAGPAGLMAGAKARSGVAVEVLVEENMISPVRIGLELIRVGEGGTAAILVAKEDPRQAIRQLFAHLEEVHHPARSGRALDSETVAVVEIVLDQRADDEPVDR